MSIPAVPPICLMCERFKSGFGHPEGMPTCAAFPDGIPDEIFYGGFDHRQPLRNESVLFKLKEGREEDLEEWDALRLELAKADLLQGLPQEPDEQ